LALPILATNAHLANTGDVGLRKRPSPPTLCRPIGTMTLARQTPSPAASECQRFCSQEFATECRVGLVPKQKCLE